MSHGCNTGEWFSLRPPLCYRKVRLYTLNGDLANGLANNRIYAAPLGGPIASVECSGADKSSRVEIFTAAGVPLVTIPLEPTWLALGWSKIDELICIQSDGIVNFYDVHGRERLSISITNAKRVVDAQVFTTSSGSGIALITSDYQVMVMRCDLDLKPRTLWKPPANTLFSNQQSPLCWQSIWPEKENAYCLLSKGRDIFKLTLNEKSFRKVNLAKQILDPFDQILMMCVNFNQKRVALFTNGGSVWMGTCDLRTALCVVNVGSVIPKQMVWIMNADNSSSSDAIAISYPFRLKVYHVSGEPMSFTYACDSTIHLIAELDGIRVMSSEGQELLQTIPYSIDKIFGDKRSTNAMPSSCLFEGHHEYKLKLMHYSKRFNGITTVDQWSEAVSDCIEAAGFVFDVSTQRKLVAAAQFGLHLKRDQLKAGDNIDRMVNMGRCLRLLNTLRSPQIGIPMTLMQFTYIGIDNVLDRLMARGFVTLAAKIGQCFQVKIKCSAIEDWAQIQVNTNMDDVDVCGQIAKKIITTRAIGVSFRDIAQRAAQMDRKSLARMLIDLEPRNVPRFQFLCSLGEHRKAIYVAFESFDMDQVLLAFLSFAGSARPDELLKLFTELPVTRVLYRKHLQATDQPKLRKYLTDHRYDRELAEFDLRQGIENKSLPACLTAIGESYERCGFLTEASLCSSAKIWLQQQRSFSYTLKMPVDVSLFDLIKMMYAKGLAKEAQNLRDQYHISDRVFFWLRIQAFAGNSMWTELSALAKSSPIGYEPFVEMCLAQRNIEEMQRYVDKLGNSRKVFWLLRARQLNQAADAAFRIKDTVTLNRICALADRAGEIEVSKHSASMLCEIFSKNKS